jgi:transcriptional regulator with PAS, ATPase and Fis domain
MSQIAYLAPDQEMLARAREAFAPAHADILIVEGLLGEGLATARRLLKEGVAIIIARGGTAAALRESDLDLILVEIPYSGFDLIRAVAAAARIGRRIAMVAFPSMFGEVACLGPLLELELRTYAIAGRQEAEGRIRQAFAEGAEVVIGGVTTCQIARELGLAHVLIQTGPAALVQAAEEARRLQRAVHEEQTRTSRFRLILDYAQDGIIAVDEASTITLFNPAAARLTGEDGAKAVGRRIARVWPDLGLPEVVASGQEDLDRILPLNGASVLCNKVPIQVAGVTAGAIVTFRDTAQIQRMEATVRRRVLAAGHRASFDFDEILGSSTQVRQTVQTARRYAATGSAVLIQGETGTGKEVFAQSIHNASNRREGPFVAINCAALPPQILESELFGYDPGAFTGASAKGKPGLFELAHGGTLFLDEIAEIDPPIQGKLLRVLQEKKVMRVGSDRVLPVDVRIIAASNRDLKEMVAASRFRADLYFRINVLQLRLHPLRERREDLPALAKRFLHEHRSGRGPVLSLGGDALEVLANYGWPGNIRELNNVMERLVALHDRGPVTAAMVRAVLENGPRWEPGIAVDAEMEAIHSALREAGGRQGEAAKLLGISRSTLWRRLKGGRG